MAKRKPQVNRQYSLDFETEKRERWAAIQMLDLPRKNIHIRIQFLIETIEGLGQGRPLTWTVKDLGKRMRSPDSTLRETIAAAEQMDLLIVEKSLRPDGKFNIVSLANNIPAMREFNVKAAQKRAHKQKAKDQGNRTIESVLRGVRLGNWKKVSAELKANGVSLEHVLALVEYWNRNKAKWVSPHGVLNTRLLGASEDVPVDEMWLPASMPVKSEASIKQLDDVARDKVEAAIERQRIGELESCVGSQLDALTADELERLASECIDLANEMWARQWKKYKAHPGPGMVREKLLAHFSGVAKS